MKEKRHKPEVGLLNEQNKQGVATYGMLVVAYCMLMKEHTLRNFDNISLPCKVVGRTVSQ